MARIDRRNIPIAMLSDFGYRDHYVGVMKGTINAIAPRAPIIDLTHGVPAQSIVSGALALRESWRFFPRATIFVAVVDPGVGTDRKPIAIATESNAIFVGPDNGLLWPAAEQARIMHAVVLQAARYHLPEVSSSFHGRDIFAPVAAHLWKGVPIAKLGPRLSSIETLDFGTVKTTPRSLRARIIHVDGFGNLISNLDRARFEHFKSGFPTHDVFVTIGKSLPIKLRETYGYGAKGVPLAMFGSSGLLEIAVRDGCAARVFKVAPGAELTLQVSRQR